MTTAKGRIHCLQFLQVQVQGMFPHKSAPSKEKELEGDCNGEPCSLAVLSTRILRRNSCWRLYQQLEPPPRPAVCSPLLLVLPLLQQLRPLRVLPGSSADSILSSPPRHLPSSSAVETPGGAAVLTWGSPRAPPAPWPGQRRKTGPASKDPAHSSLLPIGGRPTRSFLGRSTFLPTPPAKVSSPDSGDK